MSLDSTVVAPGIDVDAVNYNALRHDTLDTTGGHDHSVDGLGAPIDHGDLIETSAMSGLFHTHADIEKHLSGDAESFSDDPGGVNGVHGLSTDIMVAGCLGYATQVSGGGVSLDTTRQIVLLTGDLTLGARTYDLEVVFGGFLFDAPPVVIVGMSENMVDRLAGRMGVYTYEVLRDHFRVHTSFGGSGECPDHLYWLAFGWKT